MISARQHHNPIELLSTIARRQDGRLTLRDKTQWSQGAARTVAGALGIAVGDVRVHNEFLGGGLGSGTKGVSSITGPGSGQPASRHRIALGSTMAGRVSALIYEVRIENARYRTYTDGLTDLPKFLYGAPNTLTS
ncbi:molybdopterin cofactor-binding domain-containing protein [Streptomyces sp. NPDC020607]|uniref:molybdopterin cofactor-binding domain-containing protein n=1 Tax=Streptomyces sp. NPDC020607 TaxID=3365082 RepID=UPI003795880F